MVFLDKNLGIPNALFLSFQNLLLETAALFLNSYSILLSAAHIIFDQSQWSLVTKMSELAASGNF